MERPVLFLDVDGVLNPFRATHAPRSWRTEWRKHTSPNGWRVWANPSQAAALRALDVEIVWATTWTHEPAELDWLADLLGFPADLARLEWSHTDSAEHWRAGCGKGPAVERFLAGSTRPAAWIDDDLGVDDIRFAEARRHVAPFAAYAPDPACGLDHATVEQIAAFVETCHAARQDDD